MNDATETKDTRKQWGRLGRSILNGVIGDYLEREKNPLAIEMGFYHQYTRLDLSQDLAHQLNFPLSNKVVVFVHGLTNDESVWDFSKDAQSNESNDLSLDNYGIRLQQEFSYTPFYLRYNTGLSLEQNGVLLAQLLSQLFEAYPIAIDDLMLVGFSMGGLLLRHAQSNAVNNDMPWVNALTKCMYLGTPHEGSPLEKFGYYTSEIVRHIPKTYANHWADWIDLRSEGIKDLKDGLRFLQPITEESSSCKSFHGPASHFFVSGSISKRENSLLGRAIGDSLVRQTSAKPTSAPDNCYHAHFEGVAHIPLAHSERVYRQIETWVAEEKSHELSYYSSLAKDKVPHNDVQGSESQAILSGSIDLMADVYEKTLGTVETLHYSISEEPFSLMKKIPLLSDVVQPVETTHRGVLDAVYGSLKSGGKLAHRAAKKVASAESTDRKT